MSWNMNMSQTGFVRFTPLFSFQRLKPVNVKKSESIPFFTLMLQLLTHLTDGCLHAWTHDPHPPPYQM